MNKPNGMQLQISFKAPILYIQENGFTNTEFWLNTSMSIDVCDTFQLKT